MFTPQEAALDALENKYGRNRPGLPPRVFTEDHIGFRMVGLRTPKKFATAIGATWDEALAELERKVTA